MFAAFLPQPPSSPCTPYDCFCSVSPFDTSSRDNRKHPVLTLARSAQIKLNSVCFYLVREKEERRGGSISLTPPPQPIPSFFSFFSIIFFFFQIRLCIQTDGSCLLAFLNSLPLHTDSHPSPILSLFPPSFSFFSSLPPPPRPTAPSVVWLEIIFYCPVVRK